MKGVREPRVPQVVAGYCKLAVQSRHAGAGVIRTYVRIAAIGAASSLRVALGPVVH